MKHHFSLLRFGLVATSIVFLISFNSSFNGQMSEAKAKAPDKIDIDNSKKGGNGGGKGKPTPNEGSPGTPRNANEVSISGDYHPLGIALTAVEILPPEGVGPFGVVVILHGSGGLFVEPHREGGQPGDPCTETIDPQLEHLMELYVNNGMAVVMPSSFYSRDSRFCEDNDPDYLAFAPSNMDDRAEERIAGRTYDLLATVNYICDNQEFDCDRIIFTGKSNGASIATYFAHTHLHLSSETWFIREADKLAEVPYVPIPADRPLPKVVAAISPGCGWHGALPFASDPSTLIENLYYPLVPVFLEIGALDTVPDECTIQVPGYDGRRELQVLEVEQRLNINEEASNYNITVYPNTDHDLVGDPMVGPLIDTKLIEQIEQF